MNNPRIILAGEWSGKPCIDIWIERTGHIGFTPRERKGWNFAAGMYWRSVIDRTFAGWSLERKFRKRINAGISIPKEAADRAAAKLAKRLNRKKIRFGEEVLVPGVGEKE
ncbi:MAG: hypothetical protein R6V48_05690 [Fidelibacterota bacterium]